MLYRQSQNLSFESFLARVGFRPTVTVLLIMCVSTCYGSYCPPSSPVTALRFGFLVPGTETEAVDVFPAAEM